MKCIILLTLVALCYGYPSGSSSGRGIYLNQDGSVSIISANGRRVIIPRGVGQNSADIALAEYQSLNRFGQPQAESLAQIVTQSQGNNIQQVLPNLEQIKIQQGFQSQGNQLQNGNLAQIVAQYQGNGRGVNDIQQVLQAQNQIGQYQQGPVLQRQGNLLLGGNLAQVVVQNQKNAEVNRIQQVPQALGQSQNQLVQGGPINQQAVQQISQLIQQQQGQLQFGSNQQDQINQLVQAYLRSGNIQGQQGIGVINSARVGNLISQLLNSNGQQIPSQYGQSNQYDQQVEQSIIGQLSQIIQEEREVLGRQNQVQQQQLQQQQQQVLLLGQQAQQQQQQKEQQARQQLVQLLQQQVQQDQEEVLQQQILQQQQQQGQNNVLGNLLIQGRYQQGQGYGEQQQGVYSLGLLGVYGQGVSRRNIPLVF